MVLDSTETAWLAMQGRFEECAERLARMQRLHAEMSLGQAEDAVAGGWVVFLMWQGRGDEAADLLIPQDEGGPLPVTAAVVVALLRSGLVDRARDYLASHPIVIGEDTWFTTLVRALSAEVALGLGDRELAATAYAWMSPFEGRAAVAGTGANLGPMDAFLALAAAAVGERGLAARHADRALELCRAWEIPLAEQWLLDQRDRFAF
jgi:hypothetical protein